MPGYIKPPANQYIYSSSTVDGARIMTAASEYGFRNKIINGGFDIWQRGTSFTSDAIYTADRWISSMQTGNATMSQISSGLPTGFRYGMKVQRNAASTSTNLVSISQSIETINSIPLQGQTLTLSFWAKKGANFSDAAGQIFVRMYSGTGTDQNAASYGGWTSYSEWHNASAVTPTTSWVRYSVTGTVPSNATQVGIRLGFAGVGTAGADDSFSIAGVQLEISSVPTLFSRAGGDIQGELAACQRYYWRIQNLGVYTHMGFGAATNAASAGIFIKTPVTMRTTPSSLEFSNLAIQEVFQTLYAVTAMNIDQVGNDVIGVVATVSGTPLTQFRPMRMISNGTTAGYIAFSAEL
jgi:hypothetical protein